MILILQLVSVDIGITMMNQIIGTLVDGVVLFFIVSLFVKEKQVAEMMKNTGDSSNQLSMLNEQLVQKTRLVVITLFVFPTHLI